MVWLRRAAGGFVTIGASASVAAMTILTSPHLPVGAAGALDHLVLSPATVSLTAGASQAFQAEGLDAAGNDLGNYTPFATFTLPGGSCFGNVCATNVAGSQTVTAEFAWSGGAAYGTATLSVAPGPLDRILISPAGLSFIYAGASQSYTTEGYDVFGNDLGSATSGSTFTIAPSGSCTGASCTATIVGTYTVTATAYGNSATASLGVIPGPIASMTLTASSASVPAGGSVLYSVTGADLYGNSLGDITAATTLSITPADGYCNQATHLCGGTVASTHTVTATVGVLSATATLQITPGGLDHITISPATSTVAAGTQQPYAVEAFDPYGNDIGSALNTTTLTIAPSGTCGPYASACTATTPGSYTVTANDFGRTATASLTIVPGPPASLALSPAAASAVAGKFAAFTAVAVDSVGNSLGDVTANTTFTIYPNGYCEPSAGCGSFVAGTYQISARYQQYVFGQATLTITPGPTDHIKVNGTTVIVAGDKATYSAQAYDQYKNLIGDVTSSTSFALGGTRGTTACTGNVCSTTAAGNYGVAGNYNGLIDVASLQVTPGPLDHITLTPATANVTAGGSQGYGVEGFDYYGNDLGSFTTNSSFAITPDGSCVNASCTATTAGLHTVSASSQGQRVTGSLAVNAGPLASIAIAPASVSVVVGHAQMFTANAADAYGNALTANATSWSLSAGIPGTISPGSGTTTTFSASGSNTGTGTINASIGSIIGRASINVIPAPPTNLVGVVKTAKVDFTWSAAAGAKSYNIYRGTSPTNLVLLKSDFPSTSFTDNPGSGTFYYYIVAVGNGGLQSAPSNIVSATFK